jgi:hypothetical protein
MFTVKAMAEATVDGVRFDIQPNSLTEADVDPLLWEMVVAVNRTMWVWTRYCCEGHWDSKCDNYGGNPYLQVVCQRRYLERVFTAAAGAMDASLKMKPELYVSLGVTPASPNWVSVSMHVIDMAETAEQTLLAARQIVLDFGWRLQQA